ncbi:putative barnase/colicin E5 family endoribonuclease, partial [Helicobacter salomonis]|uniref:putative barnase/colicin E5 family endoribonuclease n=1 Tax=Helicobacter salomonis TaxID=56878 RepID=UPI00131595F9
YKSVRAGTHALKALGSAKSLEALGKFSEYIPVLGSMKRALDGNVQAAQRLINQVYTPEQEQALKEFAQSFGGGAQFNVHTSPLTQRMKSVFGEDSTMFKAYDTASNILSLPKHTQRQEAFIQAIRADESGNLLAFLSEAANSSVQAQHTLKSILNKTTANLEQELSKLNLNRADIKGIFEDLDKGTKEGYADAMERVLVQALGDHKVKLSPQSAPAGQMSYTQFKQSLKQQGLLDEAKNFLNAIEHSVYNPQGVSFSQLEGARKLLNSYYKYTQDPNLKDHIQKALEGFLRRDIKQGVNTLFENIPEQFRGKFTQLFEVALQDYATMKQTLRHVKKLGLRDAHKSEEEALNSLLKFAKGQGESVDNFSQLAKGLNASNREVLELHMLERLFKRSLVEAQDLSVFDSHHFLQNLAKLKEGTFQSQGAKDFIEIAQGFHKLFNQDAQIARSLKPTTGGKMGSSIATSVQGAAQFQITKALFDFVVRTMIPYIPFAKALNDKVSGAAFRYHIKAALHKSHSVSDFKQHLNTLAKRVEFDNTTKALIREIEASLEEPQGRQVASEPPNDGGGGGGSGLSPRVEPVARDAGGTPPPKSEGNAGGEPPKEEPDHSDVEDLPTKSTLAEDLSPAEIKSHIEQWDLTNPKATDRLLIGKVEGKELEQLSKEFKFNGNYALARQIDAQHVAHALNRHGDLKVETSRNQIPITMEDIANYPNIVKSADIREVEGNNIVYKKQINGHVVVVEEALTKKNKISFVTMWKSKGDLTTLPTPSSKGYDLDRTLSESYKDSNPTTPPLKSNLSPQENQPSILDQVKAHRAQQEEAQRIAKKKELEEFRQQHQAAQQRHDQIIADKEAAAGLKENERILEIGQPIPMQRLEHSAGSLSLDDEQIYPLDFAIVKAKDLKPNFMQGTGTQTRTQMNQHIINQIAQDFKAEMILGRGGFEDLPVVLQDGQVLVGNHRTQGMQSFSPSSRETYHKAILEAYKLDLAPDELLVRTPKNANLSPAELLNLAAASNKQRASTPGDRLLGALGKYDAHITSENLKALAQPAQSVDELANRVARLLDIQSPKSPAKEETNMALLAHVARNTPDLSLSQVLNHAHKILDHEQYDKLKDAFVYNAGSFYNLMHNSAFPQLNLAPYLTQAMDATAKALAYGERAKGFEQLYSELYQLVHLSDAALKESLKLRPAIFQDTLSQVLGAGFARFMRLENPKGQLHEFLKNLPQSLQEELQPRLAFGDMQSYKKLSEANVYDFASLLIRSGQMTQEVSNVASLLPQLEQRAKQAQELLEELGQSHVPSSVSEPTKPSLKIPYIEPNPVFGEHFAEFELKGKEAVAKLLQERRGQVAGAFYREDLGYIDLIWGANATDLKGLKGANGKPLKPYGLSKIVEKHIDDFSPFEGNTPLEKLGNGIEYLIKNGELKTSPTGIKTIVIPTQQGEFRVGLSKGWFDEGDNNWVITAYEYKNPPVETFDQSTSPKLGSGHGHLAQKGEEDSTKPPLKKP